MTVPGGLFKDYMERSKSRIDERKGLRLTIMLEHPDRGPPPASEISYQGSGPADRVVLGVPFPLTAPMRRSIASRPNPSTPWNKWMAPLLPPATIAADIRS